jgi:SAM-dependent methyltransferase
VKDLAVNRGRIGLADKLRLARLALRENGLVWAFLFSAYWLASNLAEGSFSAMNRMRQRRGNPGLNSLALNKAIWDSWDWRAGGEEWTPSPQWKAAVISGVMDRFLPQQCTVLEIGPGAGRWTEPLIERAAKYVGIDVSASAIDICRGRFKSRPTAQFMVGTGDNLAGIASESIDAIWSFDVFVHINEQEVTQYVEEFKRVLKPGGTGIIHHGAVSGAKGGWRSNLSHEAMLGLLRRCKLDIAASFSSWVADGTEFHLDTYSDVITVFRKNGA